MGCAPSRVAASELNKSLKASGEDGCRSLLCQLEATPWLFSTSTSLLTATAGTPLHVACERKQVAVVKQMLDFLSVAPLDTVREALKPYCRRAGRALPASTTEGVTLAVDMTNCKGQTPLMYACASGSPELVKLLLARGADPWLGDRCGGRTALHYAAMQGSAACVEALLATAAPRHMARQGVRLVNARSVCGLTPLHYASFYDHGPTVDELLRHSPLLNASSSCDSYDIYVTCDVFSTPLHFAAVKGTVSIVRKLLQHHLLEAPTGSQDPRTRRNYGQQLPWQVAAASHPSDRELVALLHPGQPLERALGLTGVGGAAAPCRMGPSSLASIAAAALNAKLGADLRRARPAEACEHTEAEVKYGAAKEAATGDDHTEVLSTGSIDDDGGDEEGLCGLCFATRMEVAPSGCGHGVCGTCAAELTHGMAAAARPRPLLCPFCRQEVSGFVPARAAVSV